MTAKPTTVPRFGGTSPTSPSVEVTEPTSGLKDTGWSAGQQPPHNVMTWLAFYAYAWCQYLSDGDLHGKHSIRHSNEDTFTPILVGLDPSNGSRRSTINHNGYRSGQVTEWVEEWRTSGTTDPVGWTFSAAGTGSRSYEDPTSAAPYRFARLSTGATNNSQAILKSPYLTYVQEDRTIEWEGELRTGPAIDGGVSMNYSCGIVFSNGAADSRGCIFRFKPDTNTDIVTEVIGASTSSFDTNVAIATNTVYRLKIEICGANNHDGNDFLVRFFVNGTMVREETFTSPSADVVRIYHQIDNGNPGVDYDIDIGPQRCNWNWRATPDNY